MTSTSVGQDSALLIVSWHYTCISQDCCYRTSESRLLGSQMIPHVGHCAHRCKDLKARPWQSPVLEPLFFASSLLDQVVQLPPGISLEQERGTPAAQPEGIYHLQSPDEWTDTNLSSSQSILVAKESGAITQLSRNPEAITNPRLSCNQQAHSWQNHHREPGWARLTSAECHI